MILLARVLVRILSFLLLALLALAGLAAAVFCIQGGDRTLSLTNGASLIGLPRFRDTVDTWLTGLETSGGTIAALCGIGAVLLGLLLLAGLLVPRRERLVALDSSSDGTLGARRRPLAQVADALAEQARGVTAARVKARPRRRAGGTLNVTADHSRQAEPREVERSVKERLEPLTDPFKLKAKVRARLGGRGQRVG